jgi:hypothetical protein
MWPGLVLVALWFAGGCGRVGYAPLESGGDGGAGADAAEPIWTFGEVPGATVAGVTADTWLCAGTPGLNYGASPLIDSGVGCTGLLRFDLQALPSEAVVIEATLVVWPEVAPSIEGRVDVHRVSEEWEEGSFDGAPGEANYDRRLPGVDWTTPGARPPGSAEDAALHTFHPGVYQAQEIPLPSSVVQAWIDAPLTNHGIAFYGFDYGSEDDEHPHFLSSESGQAALRPLLTVTLARE